MSIGNGVRSGITSAINRIGSSVTLTPYTIASSDNGYSGQVETAGTAVTMKAVPWDELKRIMKQKMGDLETGSMKLAVKYTEVFDISGSTKYKITYNSDVYDILSVDRYQIADVLIAYILTLSKRID